MKCKLFVLVLVIVLTAFAATPIAASPFHAASLRDFVEGPCAPGAAYDPACDVNHDGAVNVLDIQLTAGHWNQTGTWLSDNSHNHLGQTWVGANNALKIQGAFGAPDYAPLVLNNTAGVGLSIAASDSAVYIDSAGHHGLWIASATNDGLHVGTTGGDGLKVESATRDGLYVGSAGINGVTVGSAAIYGVLVNSAYYGLVVDSAVNGLDVTGSGYAGYFHGFIYATGGCGGCRSTNFAINAGNRALQPGDVVSVQSVTPTDFDAGAMVWQVTQAQAGRAVVGVVAGRAELVITEEHRPTETGKRLVPREGAAQPGEYVTIVYSGPMQVKASDPIAAGEKLTIDDDGNARGLRKTEVNDVPVAEDAPVLGIALSESQDGMVWVLVNPQ